MAFIITHDHIGQAEIEEPSNHYAVGIIGPGDATEAEVAALKAGQGRAFKMYDDDGILYYEGRWIEGAQRRVIVMGLSLPQDSDEFEPLDCFGTPNAGCTRIDYNDPATGKWETM